MSGNRHTSVDAYPAWVPRLVAVPPLFFALLTVTAGGPGRVVVAVAVAAAVLPWVFEATRRPLPETAFILWVAVPLALLNLAGEALGVDLSGENHNQFGLMILMWLTGEMAARGAPRHVAGAASAAVVIPIGRAVVEPAFGHSWPFWVGGAGVALVTGFMLRRQQQTLSALRLAQAALADEAALRERQRIAREVHDVVAHTLTVMLMHVGAARRALDRDGAAAAEALADAETLGRRSLADIRRTVGLLRSEGDAPARLALPDASDVPALLESYRAAGVALDVRSNGNWSSLAPAASLTLYRIVQEAVSNAVAHAPGEPVGVSIDVGRDRVAVEVSNPVVPGRGRREGGLGLVGMRERVTLLGGSFDAAVREGRWIVTARFPVDTTATSEALA